MAQSYANPGGTGDRIKKIDVTGDVAFNAVGGSPYFLLNGGFGNDTFFLNGQSGRVLTFDFREPRVIDEAKWYQDSTGSHGTWRWRGSNDGSTWTNIGGTFTLGGVATQTQTSLNGNTTAYRFYQLQQTAGTTSNGPYTREIEFRIDDATQAPAGYWLGALGSGDRTASISISSTATLAFGTLNNLVDNDLSADSNGSVSWSNGQSSRTLTFDFGTAKNIVGATLSQNVTGTHGTWIWEASTDNSNWTSIGAGFTLGVASGSGYGRLTQNQDAQLAGNLFAYRYYRLRQTAGTTNVTPWLEEFYFSATASVTPPSSGRRLQAVVC